MAFSYYKKLTLNHSQAGTVDSSNWPLTISLGGAVQAADADLKTVSNGGFVTSSNGYDIRPYADATLSSPLDYELVFYSGSAGALEMHVRIPTLSHTTDTVIYLAFGNSAITTDGSSTAAWDANFGAVYHLANGTALSGAESTSNARTMTNGGGATAGTGQIDGGAVTGAATGYLTTSATVWNAAPMVMTFQAWAKLTSANMANRNTIFQTSILNTALNWELEVGTMTGQYTNTLCIIVPTQFVAKAPDNAFPTDGVFHAISFTRNGTGNTFAMYIDGALVATTVLSIQNFADSGDAKAIGIRIPPATQPFVGSVDEVRYSTSVRSASWILSDYNAQKSSSTFISWSAKIASGNNAILFAGD